MNRILLSVLLLALVPLARTQDAATPKPLPKELDECLAAAFGKSNEDEELRKCVGPKSAPPTMSLAMQRRSDCVNALMTQPAISELFLTLGLLQPNGPTPAQLSNDSYASARDSGAAMAWING